MRIRDDVDFGTRECPGCACEVAANENRCPICGYEFPAPRGLHRGSAWIAVGLLALFAGPLLWASCR